MRRDGVDEYDIRKQASSYDSRNGQAAATYIHRCDTWSAGHSRRTFIVGAVTQVEVQGETEVIIPDTMRRLEEAAADLRSFVVSREAAAT